MDEFEEQEGYKEAKRERRIKNRLRMIQRGKRHFKQNKLYILIHEYGKHFYEQAEMYGRKYHDYLKICSCDKCCNLRRSGWSKGQSQLTIQERRATINTNDQYAELGLSHLRRKT